VPGLGQIYADQGERGARILFAAIVIGNLNAISLSVHAATPASGVKFWGLVLPRIVHDVFAVWSLVFWAWAVVDVCRGSRPATPGDSRGGGNVAPLGG
jgi:hypothetical protein